MTEVRRYVPRNLRDDGMIEAHEVAHYTHLNLSQYVPASDYDSLAARVQAVEEVNRIAAIKATVGDTEYSLRQQLAEAQGTVAKLYPIMGGPSVPWDAMRPHESMAQTNHYQSLEKLAERGGLAPYEAWCIVNGLRCSSPSKEQCAQWTAEWLKYAERINLHYDRLAQAEQQVARLRESSNDLVEFFTQNHEDVGEELYGRVNGKDLTPSAKRLNEMLTEMQQALREKGALKGA